MRNYNPEMLADKNLLKGNGNERASAWVESIMQSLEPELDNKKLGARKSSA
jgi:hypothetical protein